MHPAVSRYTPFNPAQTPPHGWPLLTAATRALVRPAVTQYAVNRARESLTVWMINKAHKVARQVGFSYAPVDAGHPETFEAVQAEFKACSMNRAAFRVWAGASDRTIYTSPEGNYAFRFVHDVYHAVHNRDFGTAGELVIATRHIAEVKAAFGVISLEAQLMEVDTVGQVEYFAKTGGFVADQLGFAYAQIIPLQ